MFAPPLFSVHVGLGPFSKAPRRETFHGLYGEAPVSNFGQYFLPFTPFARIPEVVRGGGRGRCCFFGGLLDSHDSLKSTFNRRRLSSNLHDWMVCFMPASPLPPSTSATWISHDAASCCCYDETSCADSGPIPFPPPLREVLIRLKEEVMIRIFLAS